MDPSTHTYLGIRRDPQFSPGSVERDEAIFRCVCKALRERGVHVSLCDERDLRPNMAALGYKAVFSMARSHQALEILSRCEQGGLCIFNSPLSILHFTRARLVEMFEAEGIPQPATSVISLLRGEKPEEGFPLWLKRGDACAQELDDVCYVATPEDLGRALDGFRKRQLDEIVACEHVKGDIVKFYGVEGTDFFHIHYPTRDNTFSKFGFERLNGTPQGHPFSVRKLKAAADKAAAKSGFAIYGGDCIIRTDGTFAIIDFNDWPSFSPCREDAATAIAKRIIQIPRDNNHA